MAILETHALTKIYRGKAVVNEVNLKVDAGELHGFLGPNGSGKTTTLGMLLGVLRPNSGTITLFGANQGADLQRARQRIGAFLEQPNFVPYLSGQDNLALVANIKSGPGKNLTSRNIAEQLDLVNLGAAAKREFRHYSLGMKQRLALAAALLGGPELLILDEPTNGLDPEGIQEIRELLKTLAAQGLTILLSSHLLSEVEKICTHVTIIREGKLLRSAPLAQLTNSQPRYQLLAANTAAVERALTHCDAVAAIENDGNSLIVTLKHNTPEAVSRHLAGHEIYLAGLIPQTNGLEQEYFKVMQSNGSTDRGHAP